jgi:protein-L-isoaspartate(D-aspartate) O-methyltransferase
MAWRCTGKTNEELIKNLANAGILKKKSIVQAMLQVDRKNYVQDQDAVFAYHDRPLGIGFNATISAPHMHAHALECLESVLQV